MGQERGALISEAQGTVGGQPVTDDDIKAMSDRYARGDYKVGKVVERATPGHHSKGRSAVTGKDPGDDVSDMTLLDGTPLTADNISKLVAEAEAGGEPAPAEDSHLTPVAKIRRPTKGNAT